MAHSKLASYSNADRNPTYACYNRQSKTLGPATQTLGNRDLTKMNKGGTAERTASQIKMKARGVRDLAPVRKRSTITRSERKPGQLVVTGTRFFHAYMAHSKLASYSNADRNPTYACYNRQSKTLSHATQR